MDSPLESWRIKGSGSTLAVLSYPFTFHPLRPG
jgi:hypothetical protein